MMRTMDCPYPGSRSFRQAESNRFFGRAADADAVAELWRTNGLTVVVGRASSGKTSLLQAGAYPLMTGQHWDLVSPGRVCYGSTFPVAALPAHNPYTVALLRSWSAGETVTKLAGLTVRDFIRRRAERHEGVILAAIDQVEDLLADAGPRRELRRQFLDELADAVRTEPRLHLLLVVREEAAELVGDVLGPGARYLVTPLTGAGAIEAVTGPVVGTGRSFADGAAEKLVTGLRASRIAGVDGGERTVVSDHVDPSLLQVVCARLWRLLPSDQEVITGDDVRWYGDADTALAEHCGQVVAAVADHHDLAAAKLRSSLLSTFVTDLGTRGTAYQGPARTAGLPNAVLQELEDRHLLTSEQRSGSRWFELLSDRLIDPLRKAPDKRPPPAGPDEYLQAAQRALTLGELGLAENHAERALRVSPAAAFRLRAEATSLLGNLAVERDRPKEAEAHYRAAAGLFEAARDTGAVARQLAAAGQMLLAQGRAADAVSQLRAAVERMPNDLVTQTELGLALWQLGEARAAVAVLTSVLAIDGGNPEALRARGEILADLGDGRDAMADLERVVVHDRPSTRAARGLALAELGDQPAASRDIEDAIVEAPRNGPVLLYAARATALGGNEAIARQLARRAVDAVDPALPPQQLQTALRLANRKNLG
jgi:tetratricopeptide (TPR) repeat protein